MRARFVPVLAVACGLLVASCSPSEVPTPTPTAVETTASPTPTETPTPTPTLTPTPVDPQTVNIAAAKQTVLDYTAAINSVYANGYATWSTTLPVFWGTPEVTDLGSAYFQQAADDGRRSEGELGADSLTVLLYVEDPTGGGHEQVRLEYCSDNSGVQTFSADGAVMPKGTPPRHIFEVLLQRQSDGRWTINEDIAHSDRIC